MDLVDRFRGCLLGLAVGDAVGTTVEFQTRGSFTPLTDMVGGGPFDLVPGQWTDDTSMALCLATSLLEQGRFDPKDQMDRYWQWYNDGYLSSTGDCFDIGNTVFLALASYRKSGDPFSGSTHPNTAGNGSIMRLAPVLMFYYPDRALTLQFSVESSRTTHGTAECLDACRLFGDILYRALDGASIERYAPDLIMGGPPCQDFSSAGKRDLSLGRADLTYYFANIVCTIQPMWFVMENVEQIKKSHVLADVVAQFTRSGYGLTSVILDASLCGVPQARTRFFLIGHLYDQHNYLLQNLQQHLAQTPMTVRDYLGDSLGVDFYYRHPRNYNRRGIFSIDEPSPTIRGVNRPIPKGYQINQCDPPNVDLSGLRPLSTIERSYLQTFPKDFQFFGTKTNLEQMIGNAVPVKLAQFVAKSIQEYMSTNTSCDDLHPFQLASKVLKRIG
jgi:DNA (cytosine-5)-methyltransferase 1